LSESKTNTDKTYKDIDSEDQSNPSEKIKVETVDSSVDDAIALFRKVREGKNKDLTEKEIAKIDKECEIIRNREIITKDIPHKPVGISN